MATVRSSELLAKLEDLDLILLLAKLEDLDLILREKACWFGRIIVVQSEQHVIYRLRAGGGGGGSGGGGGQGGRSKHGRN